MCDIVVISVAVFFSYAIRVYLNQKNPNFEDVLTKLSTWQIIVIISHLFTLYLLDQYNLSRIVNKIRSSIMVVLSVWWAGLIISGIFFFMPKYVFGRQVLLIHLLITTILLVLWRILCSEILFKKAKPKRIALIGDGQILSSFVEEIAKVPKSGLKITEVCLSNGQSGMSCPIISSWTEKSNIHDLLNSDDFDLLAFDATNGNFSNDEIRYILQIKCRGKGVYDLPTIYENFTGKVPLTFVDGRWLLHSNGFQGQYNVLYGHAKRMFDVVLSVVLILVTAPLFAVISAAIKMDSKGGIFFVQERIGLYQKPFKCFKFRTMIENAEEKSGPIWSKKEDPRITRVGNFLRKSRLDELPQLWNILKGEMSFVGPRPIREYFSNKLSKIIPFYGLRFNVKPGLSGWAQVNYDYGGSEEGQLEKFQYELFYIQNMTPVLDFLVILKTLHKLLRGGGQ